MPQTITGLKDDLSGARTAPKIFEAGQPQSPLASPAPLDGEAATTQPSNALHAAPNVGLGIAAQGTDKKAASKSESHVGFASATATPGSRNAKNKSVVAVQPVVGSRMPGVNPLAAANPIGSHAKDVDTASGTFQDVPAGSNQMERDDEGIKASSLSGGDDDDDDDDDSSGSYDEGGGQDRDAIKAARKVRTK